MHEPCSSNSTRKDETLAIESKMKQLCGQNHTVSWSVPHKAGWAGDREQKSSGFSQVPADLGWAQSQMENTEMELKWQMRSGDSSSGLFVGPRAHQECNERAPSPLLPAQQTPAPASLQEILACSKKARGPQWLVHALSERHARESHQLSKKRNRAPGDLSRPTLSLCSSSGGLCRAMLACLAGVIPLARAWPGPSWLQMLNWGRPGTAGKAHGLVFYFQLPFIWPFFTSYRVKKAKVLPARH